MIVVDAEGCFGIDSWHDVVQDYESEEPTEKVRKAMAGDVNAVIRGLKDSGRVDGVVVLDWHCDGDTLLRKDIVDCGLEVVLDYWSREKFLGYAKKCDFGMVVGLHGGALSLAGEPPMSEEEFLHGGRDGVGHFFGFGIKAAYLGEREINEAVFLKFLFDEVGVPLIYHCGSRASWEMFREFFPRVYGSVSKDGVVDLDRERVYADVVRKVGLAVKGKDKVDGKAPAYRDFSVVFKELHKGEDVEFFEAQLGRFRDMAKGGIVRVEGRKVLFPSVSALEDCRLLEEGLSEES